LSRHAKDVDPRFRAIRLPAVGLVWLCGLAAGYYALLGAAAKYGCGTSDDGFACDGSGSAVGVLLVIAVIGIVIAVTLLTSERPTRAILLVSGVGFVALVCCLVAARSLLATA
jgi:hypothetical protein